MMIIITSKIFKKMIIINDDNNYIKNIQREYLDQRVGENT